MTTLNIPQIFVNRKFSGNAAIFIYLFFSARGDYFIYTGTDAMDFGWT